MPNKFIEKIDPQRFNDLISAARQRIYLSLPNIHKEFADALLKAKSTVENISITLDISESNFRNGYGNIEAIDKLKKGGINIFESPQNMVSFFICDDNAYFVFPESRIFAYDDIGNNAVKMDPLTQVHLIEYFFPTHADRINDRQEKIKQTAKKASEKYVKFVKETIDDIEEPKNKINVVPLDIENFNKVRKKLQENPPMHPDLQRQIQTYTAKIQFAELNFEGSNLHTQKVEIPPQAMPFKDEEIKQALETKMRLFNNLASIGEFRKFFSLKDKVKEVREKYCVPITSRKKSIIAVSDKESFRKQIKEIQGEIFELNKRIPQHLDGEILKSKKRIREELRDFLKTNPPEEIINYQQNLFDDKVDDIISKILNSIKYPDPQKIISRIGLKINFYDLTLEDFKDDDFLNELADREIMKKGEIEEIVSIRKAFGTKE